MLNTKRNAATLEIVSVSLFDRFVCFNIVCLSGSVVAERLSSFLQRHILRYEKLLRNTRRPEVLIKEIKVFRTL